MDTEWMRITTLPLIREILTVDIAQEWRRIQPITARNLVSTSMSSYYYSFYYYYYYYYY